MGKTVFLIIVAVAIVVWVAATLIALRKHKMAAIAIFFLVPSVLMFLLILVYIFLMSKGYDPIKEDKARKSMSIMNSQL